MAFKLDTSKFHKVSSDKDKTILRHEAGHELTISHKGLSPKLRGDLAAIPTKKMADGGAVDESDEQFYPPADEKQRLDIKELPQTGEEDAPTQQPDQHMSVDQLADLSPEELSKIPVTEEQQPQAPQQEMQRQPAQSVAGQAMDPSQGQMQQAPQAAQIPTPQSQLGSIDQAYQQQVKGEQGKVAAAKIESDAILQAVDKQQKVQQETLGHLKAGEDTVNNELQGVAHDLQNQHIDPNHLLHSMSTAQKVSTGIGLILGGMGAGIGGGENPVLKFLNDQIDRDIKGQQMQMDKKMNLVKIYSDVFGNVKDGTQMATLIQQQMLLNELQKAKAQAQTPQAQANADVAIGQLQQQIVPLRMKMSVGAAMIDAAKADAQHAGEPGYASRQVQMLPYLRQSDPEKAKEIEGRMFGHEIANQPISEGAKTRLTQQGMAIDATQNLQKWVAQHGTKVWDKLSPSERNEGETLMLELQQRYRQGVGASVSAGEQDTIKQITGASPSSIFNSMKTSPKLKALNDSLISAHNVERRASGLPLMQNQEQSQPIKGADGKMYMPQMINGKKYMVPAKQGK